MMEITAHDLVDDISPDFIPNAIDSAIAKQLIRFDKTPLAIQYFSKVSHKLTDYGYWFFLGTQWVSYSEKSDLKLWKRLFKCPRPKRETSLMKPSEVIGFRTLPEIITVYRAHRADETDWISYSLSREIAERFARARHVSQIAEYQLRKRDVIALFLRRSEQELIMLRPDRAVKVSVHDLIIEDGDQ